MYNKFMGYFSGCRTDGSHLGMQEENIAFIKIEKNRLCLKIQPSDTFMDSIYLGI